MLGNLLSEDVTCLWRTLPPARRAMCAYFIALILKVDHKTSVIHNQKQNSRGRESSRPAICSQTTTQTRHVVLPPHNSSWTTRRDVSVPYAGAYQKPIASRSETTTQLEVKIFKQYPKTEVAKIILRCTNWPSVLGVIEPMSLSKFLNTLTYCSRYVLNELQNKATCSIDYSQPSWITSKLSLFAENFNASKTT